MSQADNLEISSQQAEKWIREISDTGRVEIETSQRKYLVQFGIPILILAVFFGIGFMAADAGTILLMFGIMIVPIILIGIAIYLSRSHGGTTLVIEQRGLTTLDGQFIPWEDIKFADVYRSSRSHDIVRILVSDRAWEEYLSRRGWLAKRVHRLNTSVTRLNGIYLPAQMNVDNDQLVELINFFAQDTTAQ